MPADCVASPDALLSQAGLPQAWRHQPSWRLLDTHFSPQHLAAAYTAWVGDPQRPAVLHYVALCESPPPASNWLELDLHLPQADRQLLCACRTGLIPGFYRFALAQGQFQLTVCVGELQALLREQRFEADTVWLHAPWQWDRWQLKALASCCRRGTRLTWHKNSGAQPLPQLVQVGFVADAQGVRFDPHWPLKTTRRTPNLRPQTPARCAVVGAGLAGASVAAALARRGWQVQVLDAAPGAAQGASGLPVGLVVPHVSADDSPRSKLSRAGVGLMRQELTRLLRQGQDWYPSGVLELRLGTPADHPTLPLCWPSTASDLSRAATPSDLRTPWLTDRGDHAALWHGAAAWVRPASLVQAWLAEPGVHFQPVAQVRSLKRTAQGWQLLDGEQHCLAEADVVVLANASGAQPLLETACSVTEGLSAERPPSRDLPPVHGMRGVLSWGWHPSQGWTDQSPPFPVNGHGSLITAVPSPNGPAWYAGATYEAEDEVTASDEAHHAMNLAKLQHLMPQAAQALAPAFAADQVSAWRGVRCVSADRLPLVGPLTDGECPTVWISAAMGSRGLSFAMLCAELLAAQLGGEPWPVPASLARFLWARRMRPATHLKEESLR